MPNPKTDTAMEKHLPFKPERLVGVAAPLVVGDLVLPRLMRAETLERYKGSKNDTITLTVPGNLPARDYAWRNDRTKGLVFDEYAETTVSLSAGGNAYSAVRLTDEQADMDFDGWSVLVDAQARAVAAKLQHGAAKAVENAPYEVRLTNFGGDLQGSLIRARGIQNRLTGTSGSRVAVIGTDFEEALLKDKDLGFAASVGNGDVENALQEATIGRRYGYTFVVDQTIAPDKGYFLTPDAFVWISMVPGVPRSVLGGTTSADGIAMRWIQDYDSEFLRDRSILNTYYGFRAVKDLYKIWDEEADPQREAIQDSEHFVRAIEVTLGAGTELLPEIDSDVAQATGVHA